MPNTKTNKLLIGLGARLKRIRTSKNIAQFDLAAKCQKQKASLSKIENGKVNISYTTVYRLAKALNVPLCDIVDN
jgi:transcriptional regulator with XRE-family HTH domain